MMNASWETDYESDELYLLVDNVRWIHVFEDSFGKWCAMIWARRGTDDQDVDLGTFATRDEAKACAECNASSVGYELYKSA
jgi:hypothetical protein